METDTSIALSKSMEKSISDDVANIITDIGEVLLDSIVKDGFLKEIPLVSTVRSVYKIVDSIHDRFLIKKLVVFLNELNSGISSEEERQNHIDQFNKNAQSKGKELEYLLIILNQYLSYDKARFLSKVYLAYLRQEISFIDLQKYAEVINRFLIGDYKTLAKRQEYSTEDDVATDVIQRLCALGLVLEGTHVLDSEGDNGGNMSLILLDPLDKKNRYYRRTKFGDLLVSVISQ